MTELEREFGMCLWNGDLPRAQKILQDHPGVFSVLSNPEHRSTFFEQAAKRDYLEVLQFLVKHGADIHAPLDQFVDVGIVYPAVRYGALNVVRWLLEQGAEVHDERKGTRRCQPLIAAASMGNLEMVKLLVEKGNADINVTWGGISPLKVASCSGHSDVADYLLSRGAKMPEEQKTDSPEPLAPVSLAAYLTEQIGPPNADAIVEVVPTDLPITIHIIPNEEEGQQILVTEGMSARPMTVPDGAKHLQYAELAVRLPIDWPLTAEALDEPAHFWPVQWLRKVALYPHRNQSWLQGNYAVISNEEPPQPLGPNTQLSCWLLLKSDHRFGVWKRPDGSQVHFFEMIPLYAEERDLELQQGLPELFERFETYMIGQVVEVDRINVAVVD